MHITDLDAITKLIQLSDTTKTVSASCGGLSITVAIASVENQLANMGVEF
jgi:hypothetical protein